MFDNPGQHKIHEVFTPSMGGVVILIGVVFSLLIAVPFGVLSAWKIFLISLSLIFITGLRDDILTLSPSQKLFSQLLPIVLMVVFGNVQLTSFYEIFDFQFPSIFAWIITVFTITILTNAYNLIDGIDGLAGTVAAVALICFSFWFWGVDNNFLALLSVTFLGATIAFLFFNWQPAKIFMGDTGSLTIGLLLSFFAIQFINENYRLNPAHNFHFESSISTAIAVLIIPIFDTVRVILIRLSRFQSPFRADRNHLHHKLIYLGLSHSQAVICLASFNLLIIGIAFILRSHSDKLILPVILVTCVGADQILKAYQRRLNGKKGSIA